MPWLSAVAIWVVKMKVQTIAAVLFIVVGSQVAQVVNATQTNHSSDLNLYLQGNNNSISGHVSDHERAPVANIRVELLNEVDTVIQVVKTDGSGLFVFRKLSDGTFQVRVQTAGTNYVSQT